MKALSHRLASRESSIRIGAAKALALHNDPSAIALLTSAAMDETVRDTALRSLAQLRAMDALFQCIDLTRQYGVLSEVLAAVAERGDHRFVNLAIRVIRTDQSLDRRASEALVAIAKRAPGDTSVQSALAGLLRDKDERCRSCAAWALKELTWTPETAADRAFYAASQRNYVEATKQGASAIQALILDDSQNAKAALKEVGRNIGRRSVSLIIEELNRNDDPPSWGGEAIVELSPNWLDTVIDVLPLAGPRVYGQILTGLSHVGVQAIEPLASAYRKAGDLKRTQLLEALAAVDPEATRVPQELRQSVRLRSEFAQNLDNVTSAIGRGCYYGPVDHAHYDGAWGLHSEAYSELKRAIERLTCFVERHLSELTERELLRLSEMPRTYVSVSKNDSNDKYEDEELDSSRVRSLAREEAIRRHPN
jgi:hypothetical protein